MGIEERLGLLMNLEGIRGCVAVSAEDGTLLAKQGEVEGDIDEVVAFLGSAGDVIAGDLDITETGGVWVEIGDRKIGIWLSEDVYYGCEFVSDATDSMLDALKGVMMKEEAPSAVEAHSPGPSGGETPATEVVAKTRAALLLEGKAKQINLLVEEFSAGGDVGVWWEVVKNSFANLDPQANISQWLDVSEGEMKVNPQTPDSLSAGDVATFFKGIVTALYKEAVVRFGMDEAKARFYRVIEKLERMKGARHGGT